MRELSRAWRRLLTFPPAAVAVLCVAVGSTGSSAAALDVAQAAPVVRHVEDAPDRADEASGMWAYYLRR